MTFAICVEVGLRVLLDLLRRQPGAARVAAAGVADRGRRGADDEHGGVAEFLELAQLPQRDRVAEVNVEAGRVDAVLHAKRLAGRVAVFELLLEFVARLDLRGPARDLLAVDLRRKERLACVTRKMERGRRR